MTGERGFTILEVMVAMLLFALIMSGMQFAFLGQSRFNEQSEYRSEAVAAAQQRLDDLRFMNPSSMPTSGSDITEIQVNSRPYSVSVEYCSDAALCISPSMRHLHLEVSYFGTIMYDVDTVYTKLR